MKRSPGIYLNEPHSSQIALELIGSPLSLSYLSTPLDCVRVLHQSRPPIIVHQSYQILDWMRVMLADLLHFPSSSFHLSAAL